MNYIVQIQASINGSRPPAQSWQMSEPPEGFALCPEEFIPVFTEAKGFVDIEIDSGAVVSMAENTEARSAWEALPQPAPEPTPEEDRDALLINLMVDVELLKLGL